MPTLENNFILSIAQKKALPWKTLKISQENQLLKVKIFWIPWNWALFQSPWSFHTLSAMSELGLDSLGEWLNCACLCSLIYSSFDAMYHWRKILRKKSDQHCEKGSLRKGPLQIEISGPSNFVFICQTSDPWLFRYLHFFTKQTVCNVLLQR